MAGRFDSSIIRTYLMTSHKSRATETSNSSAPHYYTTDRANSFVLGTKTEHLPGLGSFNRAEKPLLNCTVRPSFWQPGYNPSTDTIISANFVPN